MWSEYAANLPNPDIKKAPASVEAGAVPKTDFKSCNLNSIVSISSQISPE